MTPSEKLQTYIIAIAPLIPIFVLLFLLFMFFLGIGGFGFWLSVLLITLLTTARSILQSMRVQRLYSLGQSRADKLFGRVDMCARGMGLLLILFSLAQAFLTRARPCRSTVVSQVTPRIQHCSFYS